MTSTYPHNNLLWQYVYVTNRVKHIHGDNVYIHQYLKMLVGNNISGIYTEFNIHNNPTIYPFYLNVQFLLI